MGRRYFMTLFVPLKWTPIKVFIETCYFNDLSKAALGQALYPCFIIHYISRWFTLNYPGFAQPTVRIRQCSRHQANQRISLSVNSWLSSGSEARQLTTSGTARCHTCATLQTRSWQGCVNPGCDYRSGRPRTSWLSAWWRVAACLWKSPRGSCKWSGLGSCWRTQPGWRCVRSKGSRAITWCWCVSMGRPCLGVAGC